MAGGTSLYKILGVTPDAEDIVIEAAYRALMKRYHPDRYPGDKGEAEREAKELNAAYATLRDAEARKRYDEILGEHTIFESPAPDEPREAEENSRSSERTDKTFVASIQAEIIRRRALRQGFVVLGAAVASIILLVTFAPADPRHAADKAPLTPPSIQTVRVAPPAVSLPPLFVTKPDTSEEQDRNVGGAKPIFVSVIPQPFRGSWDEIVSDHCYGREARYMLDPRTFHEFEVSWEVTKVAVFSPSKIEIHATTLGDQGDQINATWQFILADGGQSLRGWKEDSSFFRRCNEGTS